MGVLRLIMLADFQPPMEPGDTRYISGSAMGLERATSPEFAFRRLGDAIDEIEALPSSRLTANETNGAPIRAARY